MGYTSKFTGEQIDALLDKAGQGGGTSTIEYLDLSGLDDSLKKTLFAYAILAKEEGVIMPPYAFTQLTMSTLPSAIAIDLGIEISVTSMGVEGAMGDIFQAQGLDLSALPRLTKEEFYNIG